MLWENEETGFYLRNKKTAKNGEKIKEDRSGLPKPSDKDIIKIETFSLSLDEKLESRYIGKDIEYFNVDDLLILSVSSHKNITVFIRDKERVVSFSMHPSYSWKSDNKEDILGILKTFRYL